MNRLKAAKSPYLLQHKDNPVHWWEWTDAAFEEARRRDVPVFLSIGYATCHWCHVMEHESFEDEEVAALMNEHVVSVKVDREERPDIDEVYMAVCHLMGKQGGWPLTVLLTPDRKPFYTATYLPRESRFGRIGMMDLIPRTAELWKTDRARVLESAEHVLDVLTRSSAREGEAFAADVDAEWVHRAAGELRSRFDAAYGGFGSAPKFPSPHNLSFLARYARVHGDSAALAMAEDTIGAMWRSGTFDQVGFGLHRYSTDAEWRLPHFEKMLHDQATLISACVDAWLTGGSETVRVVALETAEYVLRDLRHPQGGFYSAEDADSEGEEGTFYVWRLEELEDLLDAGDAAEAIRWFGVQPDGNFVEEATREKTGANVLHPGGHSQPPAEDVLRRIRQTLRAGREGRIRPLRDEKVLADWNGLMIGALARAGRVFGNPGLTEAAGKAASFAASNLRSPEGWLHRWFDGDAAIPAMLDDYAFLGQGLLELFLATSEPEYLDMTEELVHAMIEHCDAEDGGFYRSSTAGEALLVRRQEWYDGAMPAGVSQTIGLLAGLSAITGKTAYAERAARLVGAAAPVLGSSPAALAGFLSASASIWGPGGEIVVVAQSADDALVQTAVRLAAPGVPVLWLPPDGALRKAVDARIPGVKEMSQVRGQAAAYVCVDFQCELPITDTESLRRKLAPAEAD